VLVIVRRLFFDRFRFHVSTTSALRKPVWALYYTSVKEVTKEGLESFPPAEYAAEHHIDHSQYKNVPQNTQDEMKQSL